MTFAEIFLAILTFALEIWRNRTDPVQARLRAAAAITSELSNDKESFDKALKEGNATDISSHFELLRDLVQTSTRGSGSTK